MVSAFHLNSKFYKLVCDVLALEFSSAFTRIVVAGDPRFWRVGKCRALIPFGGEPPIPIV